MARRASSRISNHWLTEASFEAVKDLPTEHHLSLLGGTIVDATIIAEFDEERNEDATGATGAALVATAARKSGCARSTEPRRCLLWPTSRPFVTGCSLLR
jgi:hypothetical protein